MGQFLLCTITSVMLGAVLAAVHTYRNQYSRSFILTLVLLPVMVQTVIMLVNGNLGTGVAVMGAFSLVRFRSLPGNAREIGSIFLAMALGLAACGGSSSSSAPASSAAPSSSAASSAPAASGKVYYLNFKPEQDEDWQKLAKAYTEETGVPVTVVTAASGQYETCLLYTSPSPRD